MSENTKTVANLKGQLSKYSGIISKGFNKAKRKLANTPSRPHNTFLQNAYLYSAVIFRIHYMHSAGETGVKGMNNPQYFNGFTDIYYGSAD
jgi:hypothetical protein